MKKMQVIAKKAKNDLFFVSIRFFWNLRVKLTRLASLVVTLPDFGGSEDRFLAHFDRIPVHIHYPSIPALCPIRGENG